MTGARLRICHFFQFLLVQKSGEMPENFYFSPFLSNKFVLSKNQGKFPLNSPEWRPYYVTVATSLAQGRPSPLRQWCISPCFTFPPYLRHIFRTPRKISPILPFRKKFPDFHPPKFLMTFFKKSLTRNFEFPLFPLSQLISPLFREIFLFPPYFFKIVLPDFVKFTCFYILYVYFVSPCYFYHDAFMHHTMHALDAPGLGIRPHDCREIVRPTQNSFLALGSLFLWHVKQLRRDKENCLQNPVLALSGLDIIGR